MPPKNGRIESRPGERELILADSVEGKIQTVCGLISPEELGPTLMHEHIFCDLTPPGLFPPEQPDEEISLENVWDIRYHWVKHPGNHGLFQEEVSVREMERFRNAGGGAVVEVTSVGINRNPLALRRTAERSLVPIIMGCGYYTEEFVGPEARGKTAWEIAREIREDILTGAEGTDIRAGIIGEIGCSYPWTARERNAMEGAVIAQKQTGASLSIHPGRHPRAPQEIAAFIRTVGGFLDRTIMGHVERTFPDLNSLLGFAETGCVLEFDFFGIESSYYPFQDIDLPNDAQRLKMIRSLIDAGHLSRIVVSHDICTKTRLRTYGGHGYAYICEHIVPLMRRRGFTESEIETLLVKNPARLLTFARGHG